MFAGAVFLGCRIVNFWPVLSVGCCLVGSPLLVLQLNLLNSEQGSDYPPPQLCVLATLPFAAAGCIGSWRVVVYKRLVDPVVVLTHCRRRWDIDCWAASVAAIGVDVT